MARVILFCLLFLPHTAAAITISVAGDILLHHVSAPLSLVAPRLCETDLTIANLETALTGRGVAAKKQFTFRAPPATASHLKDACIDAVSLANNHTLDYGEVGLRDTFAALEGEGIGYTGAGTNERRAFQAHYAKVYGKTVAVIGLSRVLPEEGWFATPSRAGIANAYHDEPMMRFVREAVRRSDITIVMIHWNKEMRDYPESYAPRLARRLIDAGADAIMGHHSHSLMGAEIYKGAPIFYSLGNFAFTGSRDFRGRETMVVELEFAKHNKRTIIRPGAIIDGKPRLLEPGSVQGRKVLDRLRRLSPSVTISSKGVVE